MKKEQGVLICALYTLCLIYLYLHFYKKVPKKILIFSKLQFCFKILVALFMSLDRGENLNIYTFKNITEKSSAYYLFFYNFLDVC